MFFVFHPNLYTSLDILKEKLREAAQVKFTSQPKVIATFLVRIRQFGSVGDI